MAQVRSAKGRGYRAWGEFKVFPPVKRGAPTKAAANSRWVIARKIVDGARNVKARLVAEHPQGPELKAGRVESSGCASLRTPHLRVVSMSAIKEWKLWSLDIRDA